MVLDFKFRKQDDYLSAFDTKTPSNIRQTSEQYRYPLRLALIGICTFSCLINILGLTGPIFMLQIYDRIIPSRALPTLMALLILAVGLYAMYGALDVLRTRLMCRVASLIDCMLSARVFSATMRSYLASKVNGDALRHTHDLDQIRTILSGPGPIALFDLPWIPIYLAICFLLHPMIGWMTCAAILALAGLALLTDYRTRQKTHAAAVELASRNQLILSAHRAGESIFAMGMAKSLSTHLEERHQEHVSLQARAADTGSFFAGLSKTIRYTLQSGALALGAYLAIIDQISVGMIFAASIIVARTVAPIEQVIGHWKAMLSAWQAWQRLQVVLSTLPDAGARTALPTPCRTLTVEKLFAAPPGQTRATLKNVSFAVDAGTVLGILGPSGSGKSSLVRALVGAWPIAGGDVRLDGASLNQWPPASLGDHIGYMAQTVDLFPGTIAANIARMQAGATDDDIIAAAQSAGVHDLITALPGGYEFLLQDGAANLSAGQRQRIALARALYRNPFLVVLDEPNSNLDASGEEALARAITGIKDRGGIVVVVAHRKHLLTHFDRILIMEGGMARAFGPTNSILKAIEQHTAKQPRPMAPSLALVEAEGA